MAKNGTKIAPQATAQNESRLDAIKQIIFGENIQEYEAKFDEMNTTIESNQKTLENNLNSNVEELKNMIQNMHDSLSKKIDDNCVKMMKEIDCIKEDKTSKTQMSEMFSDIAKKLNN